ncbi:MULTISPECIES: conserved phage C-terminal domain-containing protein [Symbiopectobacterium]|uniref:conserved phage C-terminal domain-containing protein n=1 Tax=Candidatus Symbiopectobacterium endolongispinus TaxID=2812664 RepID=UPI00207A2E44|nr:conserved phage C-terminal domain-containing protein [Candidatus Symbiopectobacterium sp. PLON1]
MWEPRKLDCGDAANKYGGSPEQACGDPANFLTEDYTEIKKTSCQAGPHDDPAQRVLDHFNQVTNSRYRDGKTTMGYIRGRLAEPDYVAEDLIQVVDYLTAKWLNDRKMCDFLRPKTIFAPENFPEYYDKACKWDAGGRPACVDGKWVRPGDFASGFG